MTTELIKWDEMRNQIDTVKDIQQIIKLADKMEVIRAWAKQSKQSLQMQNDIAEYRLRLERKKGEWLKDNVKAGNPQLSTDLTIRAGRLKEDLGIERNESSKAQRIANLSSEDFEHYINETKQTQQEVTLAGAVRLAKQIIRGEKIEEQKEQILKNNIIQPTGKYDVIVIDPPWKYSDIEYNPETYMGRIATPYPTMTQDELLNINLPFKDDCVLWLWTTNTHIVDAYELLDKWGFVPKTILTWNKVNMGVGYWLRNVTEHCILAVKGSPIWTNKTFTTLLTEKRTEHSVKPELFYKMVDEICVGRKLDYFARKKREGWDVFGDEIKEE
jgi:N6-adenosine-specific RNA methylase IME4